MFDRSKLHAMIDELPEEKLQNAGAWLNGQLHPDPRLDRMMQEHKRRQDAFMKEVKGRSEGSIGIGGGTFSQGPDGKRNGNTSFSRREGDTTVNHNLRTFQNQEISTIERFRLDKDSQEIVITLDATSNGKRVQNEMRFPYNPPRDESPI